MSAPSGTKGFINKAGKVLHGAVDIIGRSRTGSPIPRTASPNLVAVTTGAATRSSSVAAGTFPLSHLSIVS